MPKTGAERVRAHRQRQSDRIQQLEVALEAAREELKEREDSAMMMARPTKYLEEYNDMKEPKVIENIGTRVQGQEITPDEAIRIISYFLDFTVRPRALQQAKLRLATLLEEVQATEAAIAFYETEPLTSDVIAAGDRESVAREKEITALEAETARLNARAAAFETEAEDFKDDRDRLQ